MNILHKKLKRSTFMIDSNRDKRNKSFMPRLKTKKLIYEYLQKGYTDKTIYSLLNISRTAFTNWKNKDIEAYNKAKSLRETSIIDLFNEKLYIDKDWNAIKLALSKYCDINEKVTNENIEIQAPVLNFDSKGLEIDDE